MQSPGGGAGNRAAAIASIKAVMPLILKAAMAFDAGSKEQQAVLRAVQSLNPIFGKAEGENLVPAGIQQIAQAARSHSPIAGAPPPGLAPGAPAGGGDAGAESPV
jgi:hypothetical protein